MAKTRSPNYPYLSLPEALEKTRIIYDAENRGKMSREAIATHLGYKSLNGTSITMISALSKYALLEGGGDSIQVSNDAVTMLVDREDSEEWRSALESAAYAPKLFAKMAEHFGKEQVPSFQNVTIYLQKQGFTASAASTAGQNYRDTMELVSGSNSGYTDDNEHETDKPVSVGTLVQWESQGVEQFASPRRVRSVQEEGGDQWIFVEGTETGIRASEVKVVDEVPKEPNMPTTPETPMAPPTLALPVEHADTYLLTIPFKGKPLSVRVHIPGETLGSEHFAKVKAHLNLLIEDEPDKDAH